MHQKFGGSGLFGREKDESFKAALGAIYRHLMEENFIPASKKRPPSCCI